MKTKLFCQKLLTVGALCTLFCSTFGAFAQTTRELVQEEDGDKKPASQKRVALVIGNAAYTKAKPLANPANDAADMTKALKDVGFEVISGTNQNKRQMETAIREFGTKLAASGGVGLFYYAGHGIQVAGENYLVPVDADIPEEDEVSYSAVPISLVLGKMATAKNDLNIVILDACRNNPFARSWRSFRDSSNTDGLAKISPPTGTLVLYATEPGKVASDGTGRNGLFTEALLRQIRQPNLEYDQLVKAVSADVWQKSNRQQLPWKEGNSLQDFYFAGNQKKANVITSPIPNDNTNQPVIVPKNKAAQEKEAWDLVKNSNDAEDFRFFLKEFPDGANSEKAKIRLEELIWESVKSSNDKEKLQAYLNEFPNGQNVSLARIKLRQLQSADQISLVPKENLAVSLTTTNNSTINGYLISFQFNTFTFLINGSGRKFQVSEVMEINFKDDREDLIELNDSSLVRGVVLKYALNKFTLIIGTGSKRNQLYFSIDELKSIKFDVKPLLTELPDSENNDVNIENTLQVGSLVEYAVKKVNPEYPPTARTLRQTGVVRMEIIVDERGYVSQITSITGPVLLQTAAKDAVMKWKFSPFVRDGKPIKAAGFLSFNFNL